MKNNKMRCVVSGLVCAGLLAFTLVSSGCAGCAQDISHFKAATMGLNRTVTLYANDGKVIQVWHIDGQVEDQGGSFRFLYNGKAIQIAGTISIIED